MPEQPAAHSDLAGPHTDLAARPDLAGPHTDLAARPDRPESAPRGYLASAGTRGGHRPSEGAQGQRTAGSGARNPPGERPPRRLLDRAPSERIRAGPPGGSDGAFAPGTGSPVRAVSYGVAAAGAGTLVHLAAASYLLWTGGLIVVSFAIGMVTGLAVARGTASSLRARVRRSLAVAFALGGVVLAVGLSWALSGMFIGPLDYLAQVYGLLVPVQLVLAAAGALGGSR